MSRIEIMSEDLSNKIAAGEVVERIANVVKELVENSIDAGAKNIKIELIDAGSKMIKVIDDGIGMDEVDALNAFKRHATSKVKKVEDLFFINTLGFRGEALPSIASVSKVLLKTSEGTIGTTITINGGKLIKQEKSDARKGTIIEIKDLFYNTPARLKYLKSEQTELANTTNYIEKLSLSHDDISFSLSNNGNSIIATSGSGNLLKVIQELFGNQIAKEMCYITSSNDDYDLTGYVCKPSILKSNKNYMITIVNGRVVRSIELLSTINEAYYTHKPEGKYPIVVLSINTDPTLIDVNIHPTKQDIKFSKMACLKSLVLDSIKKALYQNILIPEIEVEPEKIDLMTINNFENFSKDILDKSPSMREPELIFNEKKEVVQNTFDFVSNEKNEEIKKLELYPAGLVFGTYIVAQNEDNMYLIDQHAAQERINYERILASLKKEELIVTNLLLPISIELTPSDYLKFNNNKQILTDLGFQIEEFGINTIIVKAHPTWLLEGYEEETIKRIIDLVISLDKFDKERFIDNLSKTAACKMSVKGNERTNIEQAESLLNDLVKCDNPYNCPHGRPTIITFTKYELEKMFKRVMN